VGEWQINVAPEVEARIMASANHREGDRVPIWDYIDNPAVVAHFRQEGDDPDRAMARVYHALGIDLCRGYALPLADDECNEAMTRWARRTITRPEQLLEEVEEPAGDWGEFEREMLADYFRRRDLLAPWTMYVPGCGTGLTELYSSVGLQRFCEWTLDHPDLVEAVLWRHAEDGARWARTAARERLCPLFFIGEDIAYKDRLIFSPRWLRRVFLPTLALLVEPLREAGVKVIFHSDGYLMPILDDLLEVGIAGLNPIEPLAGMDIGYLKRRYGGRLILVGNVDCSRTLPLGTVEDVRRAVRECVLAASRGGGHFIGSSSEAHPAK